MMIAWTELSSSVFVEIKSVSFISSHSSLFDKAIVGTEHLIMMSRDKQLACQKAAIVRLVNNFYE